MRISLIKPISQLAVKFPRLNLVILSLVTLFFLYQVFHLQFDTSLSAFIIKDDPDMLYYNKIKEIFETDETIVIGFKAKNLFGKEDLEFIKTLSEKIENIDFVRNVRSLTTTSLTVTTPEMFEVRALVDKMPETKEESDLLKQKATTNYLYVKDLTSVDGNYGSLLVEIKDDPQRHAQHAKEIVDKIKVILRQESKKTGYKLYLGGDAIINQSLGEYMKRDFFVFIIPIYILMGLVIRLTMGRWRDTIAALITVSLSLLWSVGSIPLFHKTLNNVTIGIIPLIFCIALENIYYIHDIYYDQLRQLKNSLAAFSQAIYLIFKPVYYASLTTIIGFASLLFNNIKPLEDFGIIGSLAAIYAFIISIIFIPSFHLLLKPPKNLEAEPGFKFNAAPLVKAITGFVEKNKRWFWAGILLTIAISILGIMKIRTETDHLAFFYKNSEVYQSTNFLEKNLAGVSNLEVIVDTGREDGIKEPRNLKEIEKLVSFLRSQKEVNKAMSIIDFLKDMNRALNDNKEEYYTIPDTKEAVAQDLLLYSMSPRRNDIEKDFVDYPYRLSRIRCRISEHNSRKILALIERIKTYTQKDMPSDLKVHVTSYPVIYSNMLNSLTEGQASGFFFCIISLWATAIFYFRSFKIGSLTMIPNIIPILVIFGFMGWTGITLNVGTALTAGIAFGLILDDTTHFFNRFKINLTKQPDTLQNMRQTYLQVGEPMIFSSLAMIASYSVLLFSEFQLTALFGFLCMLVTFIALVSDLYITPWLLITFKIKFK